MTVDEAISWINKLYLKADFTDEYGDMEDTEPYEDAIKTVTEAVKQEPKEITFDDVQKYCRPRCLTIITDELLFELTHGRTDDWYRGYNAGLKAGLRAAERMREETNV